MKHPLPPLNALRAFEAAARHLSFTTAAEELSVTPAAVSQQIRGLEDFLGLALFERTTRRLELTEAGRASLPLISEGFERLTEGVSAMRRHLDSGLLTISVTPSFGSKWLLPRLERFRARHPDIDVRIDASNERAEVGRGGVDVALRYGRGNYPGLMADCLIEEVAFPVCSPKLLENGPALETPDDLRHFPLIHMEWQLEAAAAPSWRMWLAAAGAQDVPLEGGLRFTMDEMAVQAAVNGLGVALMGSAFVGDDLAAGRLVRPFAESTDMATEFRHYLVYPAGAADNPKVKAFRDWALSEVGASL